MVPVGLPYFPLSVQILYITLALLPHFINVMRSGVVVSISWSICISCHEATSVHTISHSSCVYIDIYPYIYRTAYYPLFLNTDLGSRWWWLVVAAVAPNWQSDLTFFFPSLCLAWSLFSSLGLLLLYSTDLSLNPDSLHSKNEMIVMTIPYCYLSCKHSLL